MEKEKRLEIKKRKELPWRKKREEHDLRKVAKDWIIERVVPEVMMVGSMTMLDRSKKVVDMVVEDSWTRIVARKELRERLKTDRLRRVVVQKKKAVEKIQKKERLERAEMRSLEARLQNWKAGEKFPEGRKRRKDWYHIDRKEKRPKLVHCCSFSKLLEEGGGEDTPIEFCSECEDKLDMIERGAKKWPVVQLKGSKLTVEKTNPVEDNSIIQICSDQPRPVTAKKRKWGKLKSGLYGWVKNTPEIKKTAASKISPLTPGGGGGGKSLKMKNEKNLVLREWLASKPDSDLVISAKNKELMKVKAQQT